MSQYATSWILYGHRPNTDTYYPLQKTDLIENGKGYWLFNLKASTLKASGNRIPLRTKLAAPECSSNAGCFEFDVSEPGNGEVDRWNLLSHPFSRNTPWSDVCLSDGNTSYSPTQADVARLMSKNIYKYNGNAYETYDDVTLGLKGVLKPNEGFWVELLENAVGKNLKLLIPAGISTDPCGNLPPVLDAIGNQAGQVDSVFSLQPNATDPDPGDVLSFSAPTAPVGLNINSSSGLVQWTPTSQQPGKHAVTIKVTDPAGLTDQENFEIDVGAINHPPDLIPPGNRSIRTNTSFQSPLFAIDPDVGDQLTFSLLQAPTGMGVNPSTGMLNWLPNQAQEGQHTVNAMVQDVGGLLDTESFLITVTTDIRETGDNAPPVLTVPDDQTRVIGDILNVQATVTDPDTGDTLVFAFIKAPAGMSINPADGSINWTPNINQLGSHDVSIKVNDLAGALDIGSFVVHVNDINHAPEATDDSYAVNFGQILSVPAAGVLLNDSDPDGDTLSFYWQQTEGDPITLPDNRNSSISFVAPMVAAPSQYRVQLSVSDGALSGTDSVNVLVFPLVDSVPPDLVSRNPQINEAGIAT
ncbi:MAG: hypothetical protein GY703_22025, partial [Gammaproteobacteria bacterium]|nr:hypothetical protein [Gammaproteobacteria bacterium]